MCQNRWKVRLMIVSCALVLLLTGCGNAQNGTTGSPNAATSTATANATVILKGVPTAGSATPAPTATSASETVTPGQVVITLGKSSYAFNEQLVATITNGLSSTITVMDHQSVCTILVLQMQTANNWVRQAPCRLSTATRMLLIPAHSSRTQSLAPGTTWTSGQYRLMLSYNTGTADAGSAGAFTNVYSATFVIA